MISTSSKSVAKHIRRTIKNTKIDVGRQHYQVIENRTKLIESNESNEPAQPTKSNESIDKIYIQRIDANTGDNNQKSIYSTNSKGQVFDGKYQIYQQEVPSNGYSGRFVYCVGVEDTKDDFKTVCILVLNQEVTAEDELEGRPSFEYEASLFYISIPLQKTANGQPEQLSDTEFKKHITQATAEQDSLQEFVKTVSFNSGRLWEMPVQFSGHEMVHLSIHDPLSRPSVLNIVLQKFDGIGVSHIL
jgi:hypothetical protein